MSKRVLVAMSGGVDSSVAALILLNQGFDVYGITFQNLNSSYVKNSINADPAFRAAKVAEKLGINHRVIDIKESFQELVIKSFIEEYMHGNTPNPCIRCNYLIKFGLLMKTADQLECDFLATGHYAIVDKGKLFRGADQKKDQSYFLYGLYGREIERVIFPLGNMTKQDVRNLAMESGLPNAGEKESQDICFIKGNEYAEFLKECMGKEFEPGPIVNCGGKVIGKHSGIPCFTIGQRKGLGALGKPMFVKEIHPESNTIVAATDEELFQNGLEIIDMVTGPEKISEGDTYDIQIRYRSAPVAGRIEHLENSKMWIRFLSPVRAIAPGQSAVLYNGKKVVAGGVIKSALSI